MLARTSLALVSLAFAGVAYADRPDGVCMQVSIDFTPTDALQIVAWLEKPDGTYLDTVYITQKTGRYGMGNRPGRADFNTGSEKGDVFPYGRRIQTFPVWAHRHGYEFPQVVFQNGDENNLSHPFAQSSPENPPPYCRPMQPSESTWDAGTCASPAFSDKGVFSDSLTSLYPPRSDLSPKEGVDSPSVAMYRSMNPFDAVSQATPPGGMRTSATWAAPQSVDYGNYVLFVEASKTYDFNAAYNPTSFPSPSNIPWSDYGKPWRGQPSVVYQVPFTVADVPTRALTSSYAGYGDPTGTTGTLNPPDATITTDTPGSGALRMQLTDDSGEMFRIRVRTQPELDTMAPAAVSAIVPTAVDSRTATIELTATGDDGTSGVATGYEVRIRAGSPITEDNFNDSIPVPTAVTYDDSGNPRIDLTGLLPETDYYVGVRPYDNCFNRGPLTTTAFTTAERQAGEVDACFVATAAYGSLMANDVMLLRHVRDSLMTDNVFGQLFVSTYYTFGPAVAGVVGESDLLRATARAALAPVVSVVRRFSY